MSELKSDLRGIEMEYPVLVGSISLFVKIRP